MMTERHANVAVFVPHAGCPHDCCFCDQRTIAGVTTPPAPADVAAACERALATLGDGVRARIAFFGGSFTAIEREYMCALLEAAQPFLKTGRFDGITASTRPDAVDDEVLDLLASYGVTALELGAQSMDDRVLAAAGRGHTAADTVRAARCIRRHGLALGLQMMTGLPGDTAEGAMATAKALAALSPDTVRIYPTVVLRGTALEAMMRQGLYTPVSAEDSMTLCAELLRFFECECGIPVIRLGLHDGDDLRERAIAGAYHPAFRELCEGQLYVNTALAVLTRMGPSARAPQRVTLRVAPAAVSKMIGQHRCNITALAAHGFDVRVKGDADVPLWEVKVIKEGT